MTLIIIAAIAIIIYHRIRPLWENHTDSLGRVVGHATTYSECPGCGWVNCQNPTGKGEVITRGGSYVVRQYHICQRCDVKALWHRRIDQFIWTIQRNGMTS